MVSSPRSGAKYTKDENSEETPKTNVKRKRSSVKENVCILLVLNSNLKDIFYRKLFPLGKSIL